MRKSEEIKLRVTADEKARWQEAAESESVGVSELIRRRMNLPTDPPDQLPAETRAGLDLLFRTSLGDASPQCPHTVIRNITDVLPADEHPRRTADCACGKPTYVYCSKCDA